MGERSLDVRKVQGSIPCAPITDLKRYIPRNSPAFGGIEKVVGSIPTSPIKQDFTFPVWWPILENNFNHVTITYTYMKMSPFEGIPTKPPETRLEGQESALIPERALDDERGVLRKFEQWGGGKMKRAVAGLMLGSALVFGAGAFETNAAEKKQGAGVEQVEKERSREQVAIDLLERLSTLPDNPKFTNPAQQYLMKKEAARTLIQFYALQRKLGFPEGNISGHVSPQDIKEALDELNVASGLFADKKFGNKDGKVDPEEFNKMMQTIKDNPGLESFMEMMRQFSGVR